MKIIGAFNRWLIFLRSLPVLMAQLQRKLDNVQYSLGNIEARLLANVADKTHSIQDFEYKVSSQWGEDGIIEYLVQKIGIKSKKFIEFGVEDYQEANTRYLLQKRNWSGLVIDGSDKNVAKIKSDAIYWRHNLKAVCAFIDKENINNIILENGLQGEIGLLSIDIDGNDYWVWNAIHSVNPCIVICEYNNIFGRRAKVSVPYERNFQRTAAHFSNLYFGASIAALTDLAIRKGYALIGSNSAGNNAFFVRQDLLNGIKVLQPEEAYVPAQYRESRGGDGKLTYLDMEARIQLISKLEVYDFSMDKLRPLSDVVCIEDLHAGNEC